MEARYGARGCPVVKTSKWVTERMTFEKLKDTSTDEILLIDTSGRIYEGLQTNFFVMDSECRLHTAPATLVLSGTVRSGVIDISHKIGVTVVEKCPQIADASSWSGCFITSASRMVKPISRLIVYGPDCNAVLNTYLYEYPDDSMIQRIAKEVESHMVGNALKVVDT